MNKSRTQRFTKGSFYFHETPSCDRQQPFARPAGSIRSRRLHQRTLERSTSTWSAVAVQRGATVANTFTGSANTGAFTQFALGNITRAACVARFCAFAAPPSCARCAHTQCLSLPFGSDGTATDQRGHSPAFNTTGRPVGKRHGTHRCHRSACCLQRFQKKDTGAYTAQHAAMGQRTLKTGQSRWFVGYKKHSFRLWWRERSQSVLLVPLVSWVAPGNVSEGGLLVPSLHYCDRRWSWWPRQVVADMGYLGAQTKRACRERWRVAIVTHLRSDMKLVAPFVSEQEAMCPQGQPLQWLGYDVSDDLHWFGPLPPAHLCPSCWQASACQRQFAYAPATHETLLGLLPLNTRPAQQLLQQVRPWIEPTQSFEKNQLGLGQMFFNSLRFTWCMALLADAAVLLRAHALLNAPLLERPMLSQMAPPQGELNFEAQ